MLRRAAFSPNIKERADCSAALFDADGELLVQAEHIPVHLGSMPASVAAAIAAFGDEIEPGEQVILNDPFAGGTHLNDITLVAPVHVDGGAGRVGGQPGPPRRRRRRRARLDPARRHRDPPGGPAPAARAAHRRGAGRSSWPARGRPRSDGATSTPRSAPTWSGSTRLAGEAGQPFAEVPAYGERRMRAALAALPDGRWDFADVLDSTGPRPEQHAAANICVSVRRRGRRDHLRLHGHRPAAAGQRERGRGGDGQRGRRSRCARRSSPTWKGSAARCARSP